MKITFQEKEKKINNMKPKFSGKCEYCFSRLNLTPIKIIDGIRYCIMTCPVCGRKSKTLDVSLPVLCPVCGLELKVSSGELTDKVRHCILCTSQFLLLQIDEE